MVKVYGASDDLVEIENSKYKEDEIGCYDHDVRIRFFDGTVIRVGYPKDGLAIWWVEIEKQGTAEHKLTVCDDEDARILNSSPKPLCTTFTISDGRFSFSRILSFS